MMSMLPKLPTLHQMYRTTRKANNHSLISRLMEQKRQARHTHPEILNGPVTSEEVYAAIQRQYRPGLIGALRNIGMRKEEL